jgi:hypothetical protein
MVANLPLLVRGAYLAVIRCTTSVEARCLNGSPASTQNSPTTSVTAAAVSGPAATWIFQPLRPGAPDGGSNTCQMLRCVRLQPAGSGTSGSASSWDARNVARTGLS